MHADLRKAISDGAESVAKIEDMLAALHFITAPWFEDAIDERDRLKIRALRGAIDALDELVARAASGLEAVHSVAAAVG